MTQLHHYHKIHPRLRGTRLLKHDVSAFPDGSLSPAQVLLAYGLTQNLYKGIPSIKIGIGSLGGGVVQADIDAMVAAWGMAAPILDIRTVGGAVNDPVSDQDSNGENMLDIAMVAYTWWHLTGTPANIVFVIGPNASGGMKLVTDEIISAGCLSASWSWGSAALGWDPGERALLSASFAAGVAAGCTFCAAAGDNSIDDGLKTASTDVPCSDINVLAVGGTKLVLNTDGTILVESAWGDGAPGDEGGGGGFDPSTPVPAWQSGVVPANSPGRGVPDVSANADPQSGYQVPSNGAWGVIGGTSASSPLIATVIGVAKSAYGQQQGLLSPLVYANRTAACRDIVKGSNGDDAAPGWDPATGCGSPNGEAFITALVGSLPRVAVAP